VLEILTSLAVTPSLYGKFVDISYKEEKKKRRPEETTKERES
jgi:hypothetical protein